MEALCALISSSPIPESPGSEPGSAGFRILSVLTRIQQTAEVGTRLWLHPFRRALSRSAARPPSPSRLHWCRPQIPLSTAMTPYFLSGATAHGTKSSSATPPTTCLPSNGTSITSACSQIRRHPPSGYKRGNHAGSRKRNFGRQCLHYHVNSRLFRVRIRLGIPNLHRCRPVEFHGNQRPLRSHNPVPFAVRPDGI